MSTLIGYARVSTQSQDLELQLRALESAGCERKDIFTDKISGARRDRPGLRKALSSCQLGDTFVVTKLDRLARSTLDLHRLVEELGAKGVTLVYDGQRVDRNDPIGTLMLSMLGSIAEFERSLIRARTRAGIALAVERGVRLGRKPSMSKSQDDEIADLYRSGKTVTDLSRLLGTSRQTVYRALERSGQVLES